ncbi:hypothetical protein GCM10028833_09330 [Glycomyces tarimensis]
MEFIELGVHVLDGRVDAVLRDQMLGGGAERLVLERGGHRLLVRSPGIDPEGLGRVEAAYGCGDPVDPGGSRRRGLGEDGELPCGAGDRGEVGRDAQVEVEGRHQPFAQGREAAAVAVDIPRLRLDDISEHLGVGLIDQRGGTVEVGVDGRRALAPLGPAGLPGRLGHLTPPWVLEVSYELAVSAGSCYTSILPGQEPLVITHKGGKTLTFPRPEPPTALPRKTNQRLNGPSLRPKRTSAPANPTSTQHPPLRR